MEAVKLARLRKRCGLFKKIPAKYETCILEALSHYPELKYARIHFELSTNSAAPYSTKPTPMSFFLPPEKRTYVVTLLEEAKPPESAALFKCLDHEERVSVIAHELAHVVQYNRFSGGQLFQFAFMYLVPKFKRKIERSADLEAIKHGLGRGLYRHATYIRGIPGYLKKRPDLNRYYLKPSEILTYLD